MVANLESDKWIVLSRRIGERTGVRGRLASQSVLDAGARVCCAAVDRIATSASSCGRDSKQKAIPHLIQVIIIRCRQPIISLLENHIASLALEKKVEHMRMALKHFVKLLRKERESNWTATALFNGIFLQNRKYLLVGIGFGAQPLLLVFNLNYSEAPVRNHFWILEEIFRETQIPEHSLDNP
ncbi:hypothetical protein IEQ34_018334 [Dendrobium chrysotoxum]|uniref:Uncharacterized protein n=1 Tax=Dendrobium chrysotoxum TaxID=161865 RepID=A0AAV7GE59_DENCH|nr:hypothetical protein IEQ34_018334 [Dendrobium chrysotoxum]